MALSTWKEALSITHLTSQMNDGFVVLDREHRIIDSNTAFLDALGRKLDDVQGRFMKDLISSESGKIFEKWVSKSSTHSKLNVSLLSRDSTHIPVVLQQIRHQDESNEAFVFLFLDFPRADGAQMPSRGFRDAIDQAPAKIMTVDANLVVTYVNNAFGGADPKRILGWSFDELVEPSQRKPVTQELKRALENNTSVDIEIFEKVPVIGTAWHRLHVVPFSTADGTRSLIITSFDITESKTARQELARSEARFRQVLKQAQLGIVILQGDPLKPVFANPEAERILGYSSNEISQMTYEEFTKIPQGDSQTHHSMSRLLKGERIKPDLELRILGGDGVERWVERRASLLENQVGPSILLTFFDITARKTARMSLAESESKFRGIFENAQAGIALVSENGEALEYNESMERILGIGKDDAIGKPIWMIQADCAVEEGQDVVQARMKEIYDNYESSEDASWLGKPFKWSFIHKSDGCPRHIEQTIIKVPSPRGNLLCTFLRDNTISTIQEIALKASEQRYRALFEENKDGVFIIDLDGKIQEANKRGAELLGYDDPLELGGVPLSATIPDNESEDSQNLFKQARAGESLPVYERTLLRKDGSTVDAELNVALVKDEDGNAMHIQSIVRNISERKQALRELEESREKFMLALWGADLGVWEWNAEYDIYGVSERWAEILGYELSDIEPTYAGWEKLVHPDDIGEMEKRWNDHVDGTTPLYSSEHRMLTKSGEWKWILERGKVFEFSNTGGTLRATGTILDITERRSALERIEQERKAFRSIAKAAVHAPDTVSLSSDILESLISVLGFDFGTLRLYDEASKVLRPTAIVGIDADKLKATMPCANEDDFNAHLVTYVLMNGEHVIAPRIAENHIASKFESRLSELNVESVVAWPILDEDQSPLGVLSLGSYTPLNLSEDTSDFYNTIAELLTIVIKRKRAEEALKISERRYRELITDISEGIVVTDLDDSILFANRAFQDLLMTSSDEIVGRNFADFVESSDLDKFKDESSKRLEDSSSSYILHLGRNDDTTAVVRMSAVPSRNDEGSIDGTVAVVTDITERMLAQDALRESETKFRRVFENSPLGMHYLQLNEDGVFILVDANPAADTLFHADHTKLIGKPLTEVLRPEQLDQGIPERYREVLDTGQSWGIEEIARDQNGSVRMAMQSNVFAASPDSIVAQFIDTTERVQQADEIRHLNDDLSRIVEERTSELAAANKELESFAYSVSHDLRAPLRTIDGFSKALLEDYSESIDLTGQDYLDRVRKAARKMGTLIEDMLALSKVTRVDMDRTEVDLSQIAKEAVGDLQQLEPERDVEIVIDKGIVARCDRRLIGTAIQNLINNAWKFTGKALKPRIEFGKTMVDDEETFFVADNGVGFDMRYMEKLFKPFQRLHQEEDFEGSGIGLATVKRIIDRHGGRVWAKSMKNEGSTFYFTLPK